jgi:glycosyltransferase involved in cell wall biosynthesis
MRILWYRIYPIVEFGGTERLLLEALRCSRALGVQVKVLLPHPIEPPLADLFADHLSNFEILPEFSSQFQARTVLGRPARFAGRVKSLHRAIREFAPDIVIANEQYECRHLWLYSLAGFIRLPPIMTFIHGSPFQFPTDVGKYTLPFRRHFKEIWQSDAVYREMIPIKPPAIAWKSRIRLEFDNAALKAGVGMSRMVLVLSQKNKREVERLYNVDTVDVLCPGGFSRDQIASAAAREKPGRLSAIARPLLLSVSRLIAKKRVDLLIKAFRIFLDRNPSSPASLVIGGTGPERAALGNLASSLGLSERVQFPGFIPESELRGWYAACDMFLSADNADYDLAVMSALPDRKKIVVSTQYEIPPALKSLRRYFFLAEANPRQFAETIETALATPKASHNSADLDELDSLTWESYFENVLAALAKVAPPSRAAHAGSAQPEARR